jgi:hypothetical protein
MKGLINLLLEQQQPYMKGKAEAFQDWMDKKHPNWLNGQNLNQGQGYGNWGTNTTNAWNTYSLDFNKEFEVESPNDVNSFRAWFNQTYPQKAREYDLDPQGQLNDYFKNAYYYKPDGKTTAGELWKGSSGSGANVGTGESPKQPTETLDTLSSDPQLKSIIDVARKLKFLDNNYSVIPQHDARNNPQFEEDPEVIKTVKEAKRLLSYNNNDPVFAYIEAVIKYWGKNVKGISVIDKDILDKLRGSEGRVLVETFFIRKSEGLINLLFEQTVFNVIDGEDRSKKLLGGVKQYEDLGNVDSNSLINFRVYNQSFGAVRPKGKDKLFPDKAPIVDEIRTDILKLPKPSDGGDPQVFDKTLYDEITKYRAKNKITYPTDPGYIDTYLIDFIYKDEIDKRKKESGQTQVSPSTKSTSNKTVENKKLPQSFGRVKEYARVIVASGDKGEKLDFDYCKFLLSEYPKLVKQTLSLYKANPDSKISEETDEIKNIKKGIKYCGTLRSGRTKISGLSNLFTSGVKDIEKLEFPFGMKETEIYSLENKQKSNIPSVDATPNNTIPKPGEVKTGIA